MRYLPGQRHLLLFSLGALLPWLWSRPIPGWFNWFSLLLLAFALTIRKWRAFAIVVIPACLTLLSVADRYRDRLPAVLDGHSMSVTGTIIGLPMERHDRVEFLFRVSQKDRRENALPERLRVRWYRSYQSVRAGETWHLDLRLKLPRSRVNFVGPDPERRFFADGIGALATVTGRGGIRLSGNESWSLSRWRESIRSDIARLLADEPALPQVLALALADRSALPSAHWDLFRQSGTGHLLAISGLHIGFAALLGYRLGGVLRGLMGQRIRPESGLGLHWGIALTTASAYAVLAGLGVSTQRALIMLLVVAGAVMTRRHSGAWAGWCCALALVLLLEPTSPLMPGFWMSFGAVAVLIWVFSPRTGRAGWWHSGLMAQCAIFLGMLPLGMYWFQFVTALGLAANLFAIPVISLVVVPLILLGVGLLTLGLEQPASWLLLPASWATEGLTNGLTWLVELSEHGFASTRRPAFPGTLLASAGLLALLGPRGLRLRWLGLPLAVGALTWSLDRGSDAATRLDLIDVGQGTAVLLSTPESLTVFDAGPGQPGQWDLVESTLFPYIAVNQHRRPARIVISHGDLDHAGGLASLREHFPEARYLANLHPADEPQRGCVKGLAWSDGSLQAEVLHPTPFLPYMGNVSSCVVSVETAGATFLLPGDIDASVEARLVEEGLRQHDILIAAHHGSRTSSTVAFLSALRPDWVLIPSGAGNRFGFPHADALARIQSLGIRYAAVSECGALRVDIPVGSQPEISSARRVRNTIWRWPAADGCP